jgi:phage terminase large subunit-like protein
MLDKKRLKTDPVYFVEKIIGQKLTEYQKEWFEILKKNRMVCIMAFRTSGKTSQLLINYIIWKAIMNPKTDYLMVSRTMNQVTKIMKDIRLVLSTTKILREYIPRNTAMTWSKTELELSNFSRIYARTYNENVRGMHVDGVCVDELGEAEDHEVFNKAILPVIRSKDGFMIATGTPKSELDLLHEISRNPAYSAISFHKYPAIMDKRNLFSERYPHLKILQGEGVVEIRKVADNQLMESYSNLSWSQEFMLNPISFKDQLFPEWMVTQCLNPAVGFENEPKAFKQYFAGIDFAMSAQSGADYTVITILEKSMDTKKLRVVLMERWKGLDYNVQKTRIIELLQRFQVIKALGDENSFGKVFIYDLKSEGIPIEGYKFTPSSKEEIIKALRDQFEIAGFTLPYSPKDEIARATMGILVDELKKFGIIFDFRTKSIKFEGTGRHDDTVLSLALANFIARHISMGLFSAIKGSKTKFNPFAVGR